MPRVTIDKTVHLWWRRWYWETYWPGGARLGYGRGGWTLTRLGARFAAWRSVRRGER